MKFICLLGKSGAGKTKIAEHFNQLVSFTTREKRENETHGVDYYFMEREFIKSKIEEYKKSESDYIIEWGKFGDNYYGTLKEELDKKLKTNDVIVNVMELDGALKIQKKFGLDTVKLVWIDVDEKIRLERLNLRTSNKKETLERTNEQHRSMIKEKCDFVLNNNGSIEYAVNQLKEYISLLNNESKLSVLSDLQKLKNKLINHTTVFEYYELLIGSNLHDLYESSELKDDMLWLNNLKAEQKDSEIINLIDNVLCYLDGIFVACKLEREEM